MRAWAGVVLPSSGHPVLYSLSTRAVLYGHTGARFLEICLPWLEGLSVCLFHQQTKSHPCQSVTLAGGILDHPFLDGGRGQRVCCASQTQCHCLAPVAAALSPRTRIPRHRGEQGGAPGEGSSPQHKVCSDSCVPVPSLQPISAPQSARLFCGSDPSPLNEVALWLSRTESCYWRICL